MGKGVDRMAVAFIVAPLFFVDQLMGRFAFDRNDQGPETISRPAVVVC